MADSDNSTTLPCVTRRMLLTGTMATTATWPFEYDAGAAETLAGSAACDPALDLWRQWLAAHDETHRLWKRQLELEGKMVAAVGFPEVEITLPGGRGPVRAFSLEDIDLICGDAFAHQAVRAQAIAAFRERQEAWDRLDDVLGYSRAEKAEIQADRTEMTLADALTATPATTLAGVAGKLDAVLRKGAYFEACPEFPWPQVRAALADLVRIGQALQPGLFIPGGDVKGLSGPNEGAS
ncbi:hypothetical protein [Agrobacterium tumefaciens]|uniref:Uncharacterized protein n=1 Tax=Agrobacterium tumefaciens TaxID=358 RepID=A0A4D7YIH6_AGRTU|nr:hypothetical protein [Agrobacterium tumefaciens]QCL97281.1 hypothetical protein CFBP7129_24475 [Agrobacterium tumefaciens]